MNNIVEATVEIPAGTKNKYEIDKKTGKIRLDRVLYSAMGYPTEYGTIENTLAPDGDPLDILILTTEPTYPGCIIPARIVGYLKMVDNGKEDFKLISVVDCDPRFNEIKDIIKEYNITKIILGLPKNMNNTLGERAEITLKYKELLEQSTGLPVVMFDERLTSVISNSILIEADMSRKKRKKKVDSIAAQIILQDYLNKEKSNG